MSSDDQLRRLEDLLAEINATDEESESENAAAKKPAVSQIHTKQTDSETSSVYENSDPEEPPTKAEGLTTKPEDSLGSEPHDKIAAEEPKAIDHAVQTSSSLVTERNASDSPDPESSKAESESELTTRSSPKPGPTRTANMESANNTTKPDHTVGSEKLVEPNEEPVPEREQESEPEPGLESQDASKTTEAHSDYATANTIEPLASVSKKNKKNKKKKAKVKSTKESAKNAGIETSLAEESPKPNEPAQPIESNADKVGVKDADNLVKSGRSENSNPTNDATVKAKSSPQTSEELSAKKETRSMPSLAPADQESELDEFESSSAARELSSKQEDAENPFPSAGKETAPAAETSAAKMTEEMPMKEDPINKESAEKKPRGLNPAETESLGKELTKEEPNGKEGANVKQLPKNVFAQEGSVETNTIKNEYAEADPVEAPSSERKPVKKEDETEKSAFSENEAESRRAENKEAKETASETKLDSELEIPRASANSHKTEPESTIEDTKEDLSADTIETKVEELSLSEAGPKIAGAKPASRAGQNKECEGAAAKPGTTMEKSTNKHMHLPEPDVTKKESEDEKESQTNDVTEGMEPENVPGPAVEPKNTDQSSKSAGSEKDAVSSQDKLEKASTPEKTAEVEESKESTDSPESVESTRSAVLSKNELHRASESPVEAPPTAKSPKADSEDESSARHAAKEDPKISPEGVTDVKTDNVSGDQSSPYSSRPASELSTITEDALNTNKVSPADSEMRTERCIKSASSGGSEEPDETLGDETLNGETLNEIDEAQTASSESQETEIKLNFSAKAKNIGMQPEFSVSSAVPESIGNTAKPQAKESPALAPENDDSNIVYLYVSLASGVRGTMGRYNKASTILKSYDIDFVPVEITLDERAKRLWKLKGVSKNKLLPAVFRDGDMKCDYNELIEANEIEDVEDLIFDGL